MTKVTSTKAISFPKLEWAISEGETKELPHGEEAQAQILAWPEITPVGSETKVEKEEFKNKNNNK